MGIATPPALGGRGHWIGANIWQVWQIDSTYSADARVRFPRKASSSGVVGGSLPGVDDGCAYSEEVLEGTSVLLLRGMMVEMGRPCH
jgi:hypothetical protein